MPRKDSNSNGRGRIWFGLLVLLLIGAVIVAFMGPSLKRKWNNYQAGRLGQKAYEMVVNAKDPDDLRKGYELAGKGNRKNGNHPDVLRAFGEIYRLTPGEESVATDYFQKIVELDAATPDDMIRLCELHLATGTIGPIPELVNRIREEDPANPRLQIIEGKLRQRGVVSSFPTAPETSGAAAEEARNDLEPREKLELAVTQIRTGNLTSIQSARALLWDLSEDENDESLKALSILSTMTLTREEAMKLESKLSQHPLRGPGEELRTASLRIAREPHRRQEIIRDEVLRHEGKPIRELEGFFNWLGANGGSGWVLDLLNFEQAKTRGPLLAVYLRALSVEGQWEELERILLNEELALSAPQKDLYLARCYIALERPETTIRNVISNAIQRGALEEDRNVVLAAVSLSDSQSYRELVVMGLESLKKDPYYRVIAIRGYYQLALKDRDSNGMVEHLAELRKEEPRNENYQAMQIYLNLLQGRELETGTSKADKLASAEASTPERLLLQALAAFRLGDRARAAALCGTFDGEGLSAGMRGVYAFLLAHDEERFRDALEMAEGVPTGLCLPEEVTFVARVLQR